MKKTLSFDPKTFQPGINYILVEMMKRNSKSDGGIIMRVGEDDDEYH
jgi:hypothetical protein